MTETKLVPWINLTIVAAFVSSTVFVMGSGPGVMIDSRLDRSQVTLGMLGYFFILACVNVVITCFISGMIVKMWSAAKNISLWGITLVNVVVSLVIFGSGAPVIIFLLTQGD
jgi:hypothetical protein